MGHRFSSPGRGYEFHPGQLGRGSCYDTGTQNAPSVSVFLRHTLHPPRRRLNVCTNEDIVSPRSIFLRSSSPSHISPLLPLSLDQSFACIIVTISPSLSVVFYATNCHFPAFLPCQIRTGHLRATSLALSRLVRRTTVAIVMYM